MTKIFKKLEIEEKFLNLIKGMYEKFKANVKLNRERLNSFPLKSETRQ